MGRLTPETIKEGMYIKYHSSCRSCNHKYGNVVGHNFGATTAKVALKGTTCGINKGFIYVSVRDCEQIIQEGSQREFEFML